MTVELVHGVCPDALRGLSDNTFHALITDPPANPVLTVSQGVSGVGNYHSYDGALGTDVPRIGPHKGNMDEHLRARQVFWDAMGPVWSECFRVLCPGSYGVVWAHPRTSHWTALSLEDAGFEVRDVLHVDYGSGALRGSSRSHIPDELRGWNSTVITSVEHWVLVRKPPEGTLKDNYQRWGAGFLNVRGAVLGRVASNYYRASRVSDPSNPHPTPKSVDLMRTWVRLATPPNGVVLDPFAGSGTTGVAALAEGFSCLMVEQDEGWASYAQRRLEFAEGSPTKPFDTDIFDLFGGEA